MDKEFYFGIVLGMLGGALVAANSFKVRKAVKEGQEQVMESIANLDSKRKAKTQEYPLLKKLPTTKNTALKFLAFSGVFLCLI